MRTTFAVSFTSPICSDTQEMHSPVVERVVLAVAVSSIVVNGGRPEMQMVWHEFVDVREAIWVNVRS